MHFQGNLPCCRWGGSVGDKSANKSGKKIIDTNSIKIGISTVGDT